MSAARMVAAATHSLCEAANSLVQGNSSEEKLIAAAKQVKTVVFALKKNSFSIIIQTLILA